MIATTSPESPPEKESRPGEEAANDEQQVMSNYSSTTNRGLQAEVIR
jgi:hypothetical protein